MLAWPRWRECDPDTVRYPAGPLGHIQHHVSAIAVNVATPASKGKRWQLSAQENKKKFQPEWNDNRVALRRNNRPYLSVEYVGRMPIEKHHKSALCFE